MSEHCQTRPLENNQGTRRPTITVFGSEWFALLEVRVKEEVQTEKQSKAFRVWSTTA
jgi:hypothetical protein